MNPLTYPFRIWGIVLGCALAVGVGLGLYHVASDLVRGRESAAALRTAEARADTLAARLDTAIASGDSVRLVAAAQTERAERAEASGDSARAAADSAYAGWTRLMRWTRAHGFNSLMRPDSIGADSTRWVLAQWDSLEFWAPRMMLVAIDSVLTAQQIAIEKLGLSVGEWRVSSERWQATAANYRAALDTADLVIAAKDSVIALHIAQRPSRLRRLWEKVDAPLALLAGIWATERVTR